MRILQILPSLSAGGAEGFVATLSVSLAKQGADVCVYVLAGSRAERGQVLLDRLNAAGVTVIGETERSPRSLRNLIELTGLIHRWKPDIVQANLYPCEVAAACAKVLLLGGHAVYFRRLANTDFVGYRSQTVVRMMDLFFPQVIACSNAVADAYRDFMKGKERSVLVPIPNGGHLLDTTPEINEKTAARRAFGIAEDAFVVAHIGRMFGGRGQMLGAMDTSQKAHDVLLKAFARSFADIPSSVLLLVGDGPLREAATELAADLGLAARVRFLGQQPEPWPALVAADLFCFPSRYEGLPNVLPEAASAGLPIVASDIPEISSLSPGEAWTLVPVDDVNGFAEAMHNVYMNQELFKSRALAVAASIRERFSMTTCAEKYLQTFSDALDANKQKSG